MSRGEYEWINQQSSRSSIEYLTGFVLLSLSQSHGARVTSGVNEGSYVLFSETRLSSEEELLLTAIYEQDLVKLIHGEFANRTAARDSV